MPSDPLLYVAAGFLVGSLVGLTGVGGGSLMTPILVLGFGQSATIAVGTDIVFAAATKLVATVSYGFNRRVDWQVVGRLALGSVPGTAAVIAWFGMSRGTQPVVDHLIIRALAWILLATAAMLLCQPAVERLVVRASAATIARAGRWQLALTILTGLLLGVGITLTSVGAGALGVVALLFLYPVRLAADRLVATDIAHALPVTIIAGLGHAALGHVDAPVLACLLAGSIPGVLIAARTTMRIPPVVTRALIAVMLLTVGIRMLAI